MRFAMFTTSGWSFNMLQLMYSSSMQVLSPCCTLLTSCPLTYNVLIGVLL